MQQQLSKYNVVHNCVEILTISEYFIIYYNPKYKSKQKITVIVIKKKMYHARDKSKFGITPNSLHLHHAIAIIIIYERCYVSHSSVS